jgi:hypothetical protein
VEILERCEYEETDSGVWEGLGWRGMLSAIAIYSYRMDVMAQCQRQWESLVDDFNYQVVDVWDEYEKDPDGWSDGTDWEGCEADAPFDPSSVEDVLTWLRDEGYGA